MGENYNAELNNIISTLLNSFNINSLEDCQSLLLLCYLIVNDNNFPLEAQMHVNTLLLNVYNQLQNLGNNTDNNVDISLPHTTQLLGTDFMSTILLKRYTENMRK